MIDHGVDDTVFIRSFATRGHAGGLSAAVPQAIRLLQSVGFDWVLLETVGVGQIELGVSESADTVVVVVTPGWGDDVQAAKAGIMEIADIFVINKADRDGVRETRKSLRDALRARSVGEHAWKPPIVETIAVEGDGLDAVSAAIRQHRAWLASGERGTALRERQRWRETEELVLARLHERVLAELMSTKNRAVRDRVATGETTPEAAAALLLEQFLLPSA
jgi:LAO/AO transport system kinase